MEYAFVDASFPSFSKRSESDALAVDENMDTDLKFIHAPSSFVFLSTLSIR